MAMGSEPLLGALRSGGGEAPEGAERGRERRRPPPPAAPVVGLWRLIRLFTVGGPRSNTILAAAMLVLSLTSVFIGSYAAAPILGAFYQTLLERDLAAFGANCRAAVLLSLLLSALTATTEFLRDVLAVRWRAQLTRHLHSQYLHPGHLAFCWLARGDCDNQDPGPSSTLSGGADSSGHALSLAPCLGPSPKLPYVDNPDQRIAADAKLLCDTLADTVQKIISAPFMIFMNALFSLRSVGWIAPVSISLYFVLGLLVNHLLASAVSSVVAVHQRLEGDLRAQHRWLCSRALDVGLCGGASAAESMVEDGLEQALGLQLRVALRRWALNAAAEAQMRLSAVINYGSVAIAVFAAANSLWVWGSAEPMSELDGPGLTAAISRASFYTLAICQGWSDLVKASVQMGDLRGYASRVSHLLELIGCFVPVAADAPGAYGRCDDGGDKCIAPWDAAVRAEKSEQRQASCDGSVKAVCGQEGGLDGGVRQRNLLHTDSLPWSRTGCVSRGACGVVTRPQAINLRAARSRDGGHVQVPASASHAVSVDLQINGARPDDSTGERWNLAKPYTLNPELYPARAVRNIT